MEKMKIYVDCTRSGEIHVCSVCIGVNCRVQFQPSKSILLLEFLKIFTDRFVWRVANFKWWNYCGNDKFLDVKGISCAFPPLEFKREFIEPARRNNAQNNVRFRWRESLELWSFAKIIVKTSFLTKYPLESVKLIEIRDLKRFIVVLWDSVYKVFMMN